MTTPRIDIPAKQCLKCNNVIEELFDSYVDTCQDCSSEHSKVLMKADGEWVWEKAVE